MNKNSKEKTVRILVRAKPKYKDKIKKLAAKCNLSVSKYMVKKALGYEPRTVPPDAFYFFNEKTSELLNRELSPETEAAARKLFDDIYAEIIDMPKQSKKEIIRDVMTALPAKHALRGREGAATKWQVCWRLVAKTASGL